VVVFDKVPSNVGWYAAGDVPPAYYHQPLAQMNNLNPTYAKYNHEYRVIYGPTTARRDVGACLKHCLY
jgi:hypothetical protein